MGFEGVAMTDSLGHGRGQPALGLPRGGGPRDRGRRRRGLATDGNQAVRMRDALVEAVPAGRLPEERLDEAAARVTALAGGDTQALTCLSPKVPTLAVPVA
jgi:beta-N-acetylhexosaminidase